MTVAPDTLLTVVNVALGAACLALLVVVLVAVRRDRAERRRWRRMVPDAWPPAGVDLDAPPRARERRAPRRSREEIEP
jgi:hypothetical protein